MSYVKWVVIGVIALLVGAVLHYSLPQHDVVRIVSTEVVRVDSEVRTDQNGQAIPLTIDQQRINAFTPDGDERVYRNQDTGWGFPWYFKFDTANLAARADDVRSTRENPKWVIVRHYGWRIPMLSMFPNATSLEQTDSPNPTIINWTTIILLTLLAVVVLLIRRILLIFKKRHVDPVVDEIGDEIEESRGWWRRQWRKLFG